MKIRALIRILVLGFALCTSNLLSVRADEVADKIAELKKLREKIPSLHMVSLSVSRSPTGTRESHIEMWEKNEDGKHKLRRLATAKTDPGTSKEQTAAPILMVKDGKTAWREVDMGDGTTSKKLVFKGKAETRTEYTDMEPLLSNGVAKISSAEKVLDHPCVLLEIREKANPDDIIASYWISERNGLILKSVVESAGTTITETKITELKLDEEIPESQFAYTPPRDAQIIENK